MDIVIPFRDGHATIERLLDGLNGLPVLVVDDCSTVPYQTNRENVKVIRLSERGYFSGAVNRGIKETSGDVLVLNQDLWFSGDGWRQLEYANESYGIVGHGVFGHPAWPEGYVQGTFMLMRRKALNAVGLLDEKHYPLWGATCDWQLRACRKGFQALPFSEVSGMNHARGKEPYGSSIAQALKDEPGKKHWLIRTPPMVSIIITTKNYGCFLENAMHSLLGGSTILGPMPGQTFQSFEVVIVDYGSDDPHESDAWDNPVRGVHVLHMEDKGTAAACNFGIKNSHGAYIAMLDADDLMEPERLELLLETQERVPHSFVYDDIRVVHKNPGQDWQRTETWQMPAYDFDKVLEKNGCHKGIMFPRSAWEETGGYPEIFDNGREDWAFNIALGIRGYCGEHLPQPFYLYRRGDHNRTRFNTAPKFRGQYLAKLQSIYGKIYAGERPMGCCGSRKRLNVKTGIRTPGKSVQTDTLIGAGGMSLLEYKLPDRQGERPFQGAATGQYYYFGAKHPKNWVDAKDVPGFVEFMGGRAFQVVESV